MRTQHPIWAILFVGLLAVTSGCDRKAAKPQALPQPVKTNAVAKVSFDEKLSKATKLVIDDWIKTNKLNEYGDPKGTVYAGGTPLFDETTGRQLTRYEYILQMHPNLTNATAPAVATNAVPPPLTTNSLPDVKASAPTNPPPAKP